MHQKCRESRLPIYLQSGYTTTSCFPLLFFAICYFFFGCNTCKLWSPFSMSVICVQLWKRNLIKPITSVVLCKFQHLDTDQETWSVRFPNDKKKSWQKMECWNVMVSSKENEQSENHTIARLKKTQLKALVFLLIIKQRKFLYN